MSVTLIDKTKPPAPIYVRKPTPTVFKTALEQQKYFEKKKETWITGVGEKIDGEHELPGSFVFACDEGIVKARLKGGMQRYEPTDGGLLFHQHLRGSQKKKRAAFYLKGRGFGLSTEGMGILPYYKWKTMPGSSVLVTSKGQDEIFALYTDKFKPPIEEESSMRMDPRVISTKDIVKENAHKKSVYVQIKIKHLDENGDPSVSLSELYCKETTHSEKAAKGFSGKGGAYAFLDEYPLHTRRDALWGSIEECFKDARVGPGLQAMIVMGGTCEFGMTSEQLLQLYQFWLNAEANDINGLFLSATWNKYLINGHSQHKLFEEEYERECEKRAKHTDPNVLLRYQMNNPIKESDIWKFAQGKFFSKPATDVLEYTAKVVAENPPIIINCNLVNINNEIKEDKPRVKGSGLWNILERCKQGADYYLLIDGVASDKESGGVKGSGVAGIMMKGFDPSLGIDGSYYPVAETLERPDDIQDSYGNLKNGAMYYNEYGGFRKFFAEGNSGTSSHFGAYLKANGLWGYVPYAKDLSGKGHTNTDKPFQYVTGDVLDYMVREANPFIKLHGHKIKFITLLTDLLKSKDANADLRSAFLMFFAYMKKDFYLPIKKAPVAQEKDERPVIIRDSQGRTHRVWQ